MMTGLRSTGRFLIALAFAGAPLPLAAEDVSEVTPTASSEKHLPTVPTASPWVKDPDDLDAGRGDRIEEREVVAPDVTTVKLRDVVPPIHFESGVAKVPPETVAKLREILAGMAHLENVRLHLVGHADTQPLSDSLAQRFGDNAGLSRERAGEVAELMQRALALPPEAIAFEWAGDTRPIATNATAAGRALNRRVEVEVWYDEIGSKLATEPVLVPEEWKRVKVCRTQTLCKLRYREGNARRARIRNVVPPLRVGDETVGVPAGYLEQVREALANLGDQSNVTLRFIGFTDDAPLTGRAETIYGTHLALSKARAHRVALAVQEALDLPGGIVESDGRGAEEPVATNQTPRGRAANRRIELEIGYDDPLEELADEPQLCPDAGDVWVTRVYDPPWGTIAPLAIEDGEAVVPEDYAAALERALGDVAGETRPRLRFVGYTGNEALDRRTAGVYGDDVGLSVARARRTMEKLRDEMGLTPAQAEHEGRGFVHSNDVVNAGFLQGADSFVMVEVVYDELAPRDDLDGVEITPLTRELEPENPLGLNLMRITVDGEPLDDPGRSSADVQRCTDVALDRADIRFQFDPGQAEPRLSVTARPNALPVPAPGGPDVVPGTARFRLYANYLHFIERAEVRIFGPEQSLQAEPLAVVPIGADGEAVWQAPVERFAGPVRELRFLLRAYGREGQFDETETQPLWLFHPDAAERAALPAAAQPLDPDAAADGPRLPTDVGLLAGYGESRLASQAIPLGNVGRVHVSGHGIPAEHAVWLAGEPLPVDEGGSFVGEVLLPRGTHTVEVAVLDREGNGELFLRDLEFGQSSWFYMGVADLTLQSHDTSGPIDQLTGDESPDTDSAADGRLAFFVDGKFREDWGLVASADTRDGPVDQLFTNFVEKTPEALLRRIDPEYHYPTFGDDGTVTELAPTSGKFFVKLNKAKSHALWGNFTSEYLDNELAQIDRGLYGANVHYQSPEGTRFGEQRLVVDGFAADPGTVPSRDEFRGTGGSLYFLQNRDLLTGSERVRIEVRDRDSGLVKSVVHLQPVLDYDIDYLQGRVLLTEPLSANVDANLLVRTSGLDGDEAWLVVQYEYTPGFEDLDTMSTGGQGQYWFNDFVKLGVIANQNDQDGGDTSLYGGDLVVRRSTDTFMKLQAGRTEGLLSNSYFSSDGGFGFGTTPGLDLSEDTATGLRGDVSVAFSDFVEGARGTLSLYAQDLGAGYSAPGMNALTDTQQLGGLLRLPLGERFELTGKADQLVQDQGLETTTQELDLGYRLTNQWSLRGGVRNDDREVAAPLAFATQEEGQRTDAVVQLGFDSLEKWRAYGFLQETLAKSGNREDNGRVGVGGAYRFNDRLQADGELSHGDLGLGARLGTQYKATERSQLYLNYALENERTDNGQLARGGSLVTGGKSRLSDSTSVYAERRQQRTNLQTGLTHATGITLAPSDRWNLGANADVGTLIDRLTGAETERRAGGARIGYGFEKVQLSSALEYRFDETEQLDGTWSDRRTWLLRNTMKWETTPEWRFLGKLDWADSQSSFGDFYDGGYREASLGYAYRPVKHDRWNAFAKYTYFYNIPATDPFTVATGVTQYLQQSHIASLDVTYALGEKWTLGGKYAYRIGEVSLDRESPDFFGNDAHLGILRADYEFLPGWEASIEGRMLDLVDFQERRSGALVALYRYFGNHFKVGVGYNFTDFSDDLTDLGYDHQGVFLNVVGTL